MRMLSLVAEQQLYLPSQVIINKGDVGQHMYIITRGEAEVSTVQRQVKSFFVCLYYKTELSRFTYA